MIFSSSLLDSYLLSSEELSRRTAPRLSALRSYAGYFTSTFTLIHEYRGPTVTLYHIDLYRIDTQRELDTLALDDLMSPQSILRIEWGEKFERFAKERDVEIAIEHRGGDERIISLKSRV